MIRGVVVEFAGQSVCPTMILKLSTPFTAANVVLVMGVCLFVCLDAVIEV